MKLMIIDFRTFAKYIRYFLDEIVTDDRHCCSEYYMLKRSTAFDRSLYLHLQ